MSPASAETVRGRRTALLLVVAAALALRLPGHLDSGLWFDEIRTLIELRRASFAAVVGAYWGDNQHPLFSVLAWLSLRGLGASAWTLRLPAVIFGALSIGAFWLYAERVARRGEALLATALLATSYHHVWFSQNARGYTALLFFTLVATLAFERLVDSGDRRARWPYAIALALAVYTHLTAALLAAGHLVALVALRRSQPRSPERDAAWRLPLGAVALGTLLAAALYAPMAPDAARYFWQRSLAPTAASSPYAAVVPTVWASPGWAIEAAAASLGVGVATGLGLLLAVTALLSWGTLDYARQGFWRLLLWGAPAVLLALVLALLGRNLWPRFFFFLAGFVLLVLVRGMRLLITALWPRGAAGRDVQIAALALLAAWTALLPRAYALPKQDFEGAREFLARTRQRGEAVATTGLAAMPYRAYLETDFVEVLSVAELDALAASSSGVYVVATLPEYLASRRPELAAALAARGREIARFHGSVGDGDVVVMRLDGGAP